MAGRGGTRPGVEHVAIEAAVTLRLLFRLPWRQTEGLLASIFTLLDLGLKAPDHTTLSRRSGGPERVNRNETAVMKD